jgi:hypothetical protein
MELVIPADNLEMKPRIGQRVRRLSHRIRGHRTLLLPENPEITTKIECTGLGGGAKAIRRQNLFIFRAWYFV